MQLNDRQETAAAHRTGPMLVLAGPGSGKTAVITERTCRLVRAGEPAGCILVVTFTRAAAAEMRGRIHRALGAGAAGLTIGTFHGVFYGILRQECRLRSDCILDGKKRRELLTELISRRYRNADQEAELPELVGREISLLKNSTVKPQHFYSNALPEETFRDIFRQYQEWMRENGRMDFDDIIRRCYELLRGRPDVLQRWQKKFRHILVDEFQDIAPMQYEIVRALTLPENNLFAVGDDDQSIYRFRGANPELMLGFQKYYPDAKIVTLDRNYRSTPEILKTAQQLIRSNRRRFEKEQHAGKANGEPVRMHLFANTFAEAAWISKEIRKLAADGMRYEDMAVLFRTNSGCRNVISQFITEQIPFYTADLIPGIFDHWICRDILAYMELAAGSRRRGDFLRICNKPNRYLSRQAFSDREVPFAVLYDYYEDKDWMCDRIIKMEEDLRYLAKLPPYGAIVYIQKVIGYDEYLREYAAEHRMEPGDLQNVLEELKESAQRCADLNGWKHHMEQMRENLRRRPDECTGVAVSTLHAAKGREYRAVFIADVNEGIIPWQKAVLDADLEEERRMLYVGMTRAEEILHILAVKKRFEKTLEPSGFLEGLFKEVREEAL